MRSIAAGKNLLGENSNGIFSCCDCGICTYYACNFGLKPSKVMQALKQSLAGAGIKPKKEVFAEPDGGLELKKLPVSRMIARLGIAEYDVPAPMEFEVLPVREVSIPLRMHIGAPAVPVVKEGQRVEKGMLIAEIPEKALGARIHASISGTVREITAEAVRIRGDDV
jgi:Na+-translocating ferredoxin:NAD+ oxidoreductase RnfC subunit